MARFQLVFRRAGQDDRSEYRFNDSDGHPEIDGRSIVDGETYVIRGSSGLSIAKTVAISNSIAKDSRNLPRFVCTLVVEPAEAADPV